MAAEQWTCARCAAKNDGGGISCASCGLLWGSVAPPPSTVTPSADAGPAPGPGPAPDTVETAWVPPGGGAPEPPQRRSLLSRLPLGLIVGGGVIAVVAIAGLIFAAGRSPEGDIVKTGDLDASELRVGDCFDLKDPDAEEVYKVTAKPCAEAHEFEVFYTGEMPDGDFPTDPDATFEAFVADECLPAFRAYVGLPYEDSVLELFYFFPSKDAWGGGDHSVQCAAYDPDDPELTVSVEGADR
jgi:hypothetical protein